MTEKDIVKVLKLLDKCPIRSWHDLDEDATQNDVWAAQAQWIKKELDSDFFDSI